MAVLSTSKLRRMRAAATMKRLWGITCEPHNDKQHTSSTDSLQIADPWTTSGNSTDIVDAPTTPRGKSPVLLDQLIPDTTDLKKANHVDVDMDVVNELQYKLNAVEVELKRTKDIARRFQDSQGSVLSPRTREQACDDLTGALSAVQVPAPQNMAQLIIHCVNELPKHLDKPIASLVALISGMENIKQQRIEDNLQKAMDEKEDLVQTLSSHVKAAARQRHLVESVTSALQEEKNELKKQCTDKVNRAQQQVVSLQSQVRSMEAQHALQIKKLSDDRAKLEEDFGDLREASDVICANMRNQIADLHLRLQDAHFSPSVSAEGDDDRFPKIPTEGLDYVQHRDGSRSTSWNPGCIDELENCRGILAVLAGLKSKPHLNGQKGILHSWDYINGRLEFRMESGASIAVKPANVVVRIDFEQNGRGYVRRADD